MVPQFDIGTFSTSFLTAIKCKWSQLYKVMGECYNKIFRIVKYSSRIDYIISSRKLGPGHNKVIKQLHYARYETWTKRYQQKTVSKVLLSSDEHKSIRYEPGFQ